MRKNRPPDSNPGFFEVVPGIMGLGRMFCSFRFIELFFPFQSIAEQFL
jgi:hypothetical protein